MVPNKEPLKIKWRSKVSKVEVEAIRDVETTRMSNAIIIINLDTIPRIACTELKILPISLK